ncbi:Fic family protein [Pseudomonas nabeulensis]|uniref:Fic family protein n=2 Tax=Pseudomonas TaxID=286 RepID=A0A4Z0B3S9_9PSED|nr:MULTISPECIES: Fic family protein [Pseudomonas]MQT88081.1 cell filamentation protein Fic [Pseudomonas helleri]TFY92878.1 Fic family protein [Pseudomonas nabeulensis]
MAMPSDKLATALVALKQLQDQGLVAIRSSQLSRTHRERLQNSGFLAEVMKGWYIPTRPDETQGESTAWYASFWAFSGSYLTERFGADWCLGPEQSLSLLTGDWTVPRQLMVRSSRGGNKPLSLPHQTSIFDIRVDLPPDADLEVRDGLRLYTLPAALVTVGPAAFQTHPVTLRTALAMIRDASDVLARLLDGGHSVVAGRLAGAFRSIGGEQIANDIVDAMRAAGYAVKETNPFADLQPTVVSLGEPSPYVNRLGMTWQRMREQVLDHFPRPSQTSVDKDTYLRQVDDVYITDAYHSLSIEGYRVSAELIERVRSGSWNPDDQATDRNHRDALAARGYWLAFQRVKQSLGTILDGKNPGVVAQQDHGAWYRELFAPSVTAGILRPGDLAGYRSGPVYIRRSKHVPPRHDAVRDLMPAFFRLLQEESDPAVRVVLGHFVFVYIHPYFDGNGRMGRFMMNAMLAAGGYPWTVVPVESRSDYMAALEEASVEGNLVPFSQFIGQLVERAPVHIGVSNRAAGAPDRN